MRASNSSGLIRFRFAIVLLSEHTKDVKAESLDFPERPEHRVHFELCQRGLGSPPEHVWIVARAWPRRKMAEAA
jgi:hypothetical protein